MINGRCVLLVVSLWVPMAMAQDDAQRLEERLHAFLAGVTAGDASVHEWFWADDLVYTSSAGERIGKSNILASTSASAEEVTTLMPAYRAEAVDVRVYGDAAVVAFRLVSEMPATESGDRVVEEYFNTGTFLRRDGDWSAVAWQATRIP